MAGGAIRILLSCTLFIFTGLVQTVCIQAVLYSGGGDRSTFLLAIPNYLGIVAVSFLGARMFRFLDNLAVFTSPRHTSVSPRVHLASYTRNPKIAPPKLGFFRTLIHPDRRKLFILAFNELGGFLTGLTGLSIAGSGLYQVVFSGATVFTALLSTFFLRKRLSISQWLAVAVITIGLMITAEQVTHTPSDAAASSLVSGIMFVLVSCLFYSTNYVIAEHLLALHAASVSTLTSNSSCTSLPSTTVTANADAEEGDDDVGDTTESQIVTPSLPPPSGLDLSLYTGGTCLFIFTLYVLAHTIPNWHVLVTRSIERNHGNTTLIVEYYVYLTLASFFHAVTHYDVVATVGAVPIGVLNALRAVTVFAVSSYLFCAHQASQCFTARKGVSTAVVVGGALAYSAASAVVERRRSGAGVDGRVKEGKEVVGGGKTAGGANVAQPGGNGAAMFGARLRSAVSSYVQARRMAKKSVSAPLGGTGGSGGDSGSGSAVRVGLVAVNAGGSKRRKDGMLSGMGDG